MLAGPGVGDRVQPLQFGADPLPGPGVPGGGLGDADQQQGQPAQQDVGADPVLAPVVDRAQVEDLLHVTPAAFDFQQLLVSQGDVLGGQAGVGAAQQVLAVQVRLGLDLRLVDPQQPTGGGAQEPLESRLARQRALDPAAFGRGQLVRIGDDFFEPRDELPADNRVAFGLGGVVAEHEPVVGADADFLDPHVVLDGRVAALPRQGRFDLSGAGPRFLPDDVPAAAPHQRPPVLLRGEATVSDPDHPGQGPFPDVGADLPDQVGVRRVPRPGPHPHRDPVPGDRHPDHHLRQVVPGVLRFAVGAEPGVFYGRVVVLVRALAVAVAGHRLVGLAGLEVGGGGVSVYRLIGACG